MKTIRALASKIAKIEGKKSQTRIGDIREILAILSDIVHEEGECNKDRHIFHEGSCVALLWDNGKRRCKE